MCGIVAVLNRDGSPVNEVLLAEMTDIVSHRGPDDRGTFVDGPVGLGHRRLSIIDLSSAGHQPMTNEDESLWLVFNGEIFNYKELIPDLVARGHHFRSHTDTEVILHAYEEWGVECLQRFNGMWAFALWDSRRKHLFVARDRSGVKPLYYVQNAKHFLASSEIKSLLLHPAVPRTVNHATLYRFLKFGLKDMDESTCFSHVQQLPPAHYLLVKDGELQIRRYWSADTGAEDYTNWTDEQFSEKFLELLTDSVRLRLRSDVPVGLSLSGGLDSSTLASLVNQISPRPIKSFSITYPGTAADESHYVRDVVAHCRNIHPHAATPDGRDMFDVLCRSVWHFDEPTWGTYVYSWWRLMKLIREGGVTVLLNGQGADEQLAGYPAHYPTYLRQLLFTGRLSEFWPEARTQAQKYGHGIASELRGLMSVIWPDWLRSPLAGIGLSRSFDDSFLTPEFKREAGVVDRREDRKAFFSLRTHLSSDFERTRLPELLHAEDRFSMAFSLESRNPFLDFRLVEFLNRLPDEQKLRRSVTKVVMRNAIRSRLPSSVVERTDKMGYPTPAEEWFRTTARAEFEELFHSQALREHGVFQPDVIQRAFSRFCRGEGSGRELWRWASVEVWMRSFIDRSPVESRPYSPAHTARVPLVAS